MAETTYTSVTWTTGDTITEAKLDNMVANDQAVDSHAQGVEFAERSAPSTPGANKLHVYAKDDSGTTRLYFKDSGGTELTLAPVPIKILLSAMGGFQNETSKPALTANTGLTNKKDYTLDYDDTTDEIESWEISIPPGIVITKATLYVTYRMASATADRVVWACTHGGINDGEAYDAAGSTDTFTADTVPDTAGKVAIHSKALTTTGWAAGDTLHVKISRDANNASDDATGDAKFMHGLLVIE
jgi:hypothetical protein